MQPESSSLPRSSSLWVRGSLGLPLLWRLLTASPLGRAWITEAARSSSSFARIWLAISGSGGRRGARVEQVLASEYSAHSEKWPVYSTSYLGSMYFLY
jgi:hypothetical protein